MAEQQEKPAAKNTVTVELTGPCKKKVIVEIPGETIKKATDEQYETFRREALVEYLMDCGYELDRDDNRGFANEYTMILRDTGDRPEEPTEDEAEEWADAFLYSGDAATESFVNFKFEEA